MVFIVKIPLKAKQQEEQAQPEHSERQQQDAPAPSAVVNARPSNELDLLLASMSLTQAQDQQPASRSSTPPPRAPSSSTLSSPPPLSLLDEAAPAAAAAVLDVYLAPAVEQHRYVRTRDVSLIVERPQRIRAVCLAVAAVLARCHDDDESSNSSALAKAMESMHVADDKRASHQKVPLIRVLVSQARMYLACPTPALLSVHGQSAMMGGETSATSPKDVRVGETYAAYLARLCKAAPTAPPFTAPVTPTRELQRRLDVHAASSSSSSDNSSNSDMTPPRTSEVPIPWSQGDLYLCGDKGEDDGGSAAAIETCLGTLCAAIDALYQPVSSRVSSALTPLLPDPHSTSAQAAKRAFVLTRPPGHHCGDGAENGGPSGFCWVNNVAVGAAHAFAQHGVDRIICLDIDLHHGNGTQSIAWRINAETVRSDMERQARLKALGQAHAKAHESRKTATARRSAPSVTTADTQPSETGSTATEAAALEAQVPPRGLKIFYGSMHDIESYPCEDGDADLVRDASVCVAGAHGQWIWNVHLEACDAPSDFERVYRQKYSALLTQARLFARQTDALPSRTLVLLSTGMDACIGELPGLQRHGKSLPVEFYHRFTSDACALANEVAEGKLISVLEGGYSDRALTTASLAHCAALATAPVIASTSSSTPDSSSAPSTWWDADTLTHLDKLAKRYAAPAPSTPAALASASARRRAEPSWLQAACANFEALERACGRTQPTRAKSTASAPVSPANTTPRMGTRAARTRAAQGLSPASVADTTV